MIFNLDQLVLQVKSLTAQRVLAYFFGSSSTARSWDSTQGFGSRSYISRFLRRCNGGVGFAGASGVSGEDSVAQVARLPGVLAALSSSTGARPTLFVLQVAGNDIVNTNNLQTVTLPSISAMVQMVLDAGFTPVLVTNNSLLGLTGAQVIRAAAISDYMRMLWRNDPRIRLADVARITGDTTTLTYTPVAGATSIADNLHPTSIGAFLMGDALYEAVYNDVVGFSNGAALPNLLYDATNNPRGNLLANPFLVTDSGGVAQINGSNTPALISSGTVPRYMTLNKTAGSATGTVAISKVTRTDRAGQWTRFVFTMNAGDTYSMYINPSITTLSNVTMVGMSEVNVDTTSSNGGVKRASLRVRDAANTQTMWDGHTGTFATASDIIEPTRNRQEFWQTPPALWAGTYGNGSLSHDLEFTAAGTFILDIGATGLYSI